MNIGYVAVGVGKRKPLAPAQNRKENKARDERPHGLADAEKGDAGRGDDEGAHDRQARGLVLPSARDGRAKCAQQREASAAEIAARLTARPPPAAARAEPNPVTSIDARQLAS